MVRRSASDPNPAAFLQCCGPRTRSFTVEEDFVKNYLSLRQNADEARPVSKFKPAVLEVIDAYRGTAALKRFDLFAKAINCGTCGRWTPR